MLKRISLTPALVIFSTPAFCQFTYKIKADSVLITKDSCDAELINMGMTNKTTSIRAARTK
jgi:hypothetical protein